MAIIVKRPIRIEGQVAYVPLTRGYEAVIDTADLPLIEGKNWYAQNQDKIVYPTTGIVREDGTRRAYRMHKILLSPPDGYVVDHANGNGLDNRRVNLRLATFSQNCMNIGLNKRSKSGLKGAFFHLQRNRWTAQIRINGVRTHLGLFDTPEEAHEAYMSAARKHFGEFARAS